jgi:hypothetical protein
MGAPSPAELGWRDEPEGSPEELMQMFRGQVEQFLGVWTQVWSAEQLQGGGAVLQDTQSDIVVGLEVDGWFSLAWLGLGWLGLRGGRPGETRRRARE